MKGNIRIKKKHKSKYLFSSSR